MLHYRFEGNHPVRKSFRTPVVFLTLAFKRLIEWGCLNSSCFYAGDKTRNGQVYVNVIRISSYRVPKYPLSEENNFPES